MNAKVYAEVHSELFNAGRDEDGREFHAERFGVLLRFPNGRNYLHRTMFNGTKVEYSEEDGYPFFPDLREQAKADATKLCHRVNEALNQTGVAAINMAHWNTFFATYGSEAYDDFEAKDWERRVDEDEAAARIFR